MAKFSIVLRRNVEEYTTSNKEADTEAEAIQLALAEVGAGIGMWRAPNFVQNPELFAVNEHGDPIPRAKPEIEVVSTFKHGKPKTLTLPKK